MNKALGPDGIFGFVVVLASNALGVETVSPDIEDGSSGYASEASASWEVFLHL